MKRIGHLGSVVIVVGAAHLTGCTTNTPDYIPAPTQLESTGMEMNADGDLIGVRAELPLPFETETTEDRAARDARAAALLIDVPYVKVGDVEMSIEWTIKNLDGEPGNARIQLNGANELFSYDPTLVVLSAMNDREAPPTPGLEGDVPIHVAANGTVSGLFREDQLLEAAIDLDQITRGNVSPFAATLQIDKNATMFQPMTPPMPDVMDYVQMPIGDPIPREAFANFVRLDLVFKPDRHMVLEYAVRIRDLRGIVDDKLLAAPASELAVFEPMPYVPNAP
ncbi:MAG: hypothetical protein NT062_00190 [Proteobacteria bacterium]|nr:hypothetical protein [Pseudomonadota bacterium]